MINVETLGGGWRAQNIDKIAVFLGERGIIQDGRALDVNKRAVIPVERA